jgi:hypothetical protein
MRYRHFAIHALWLLGIATIQSACVQKRERIIELKQSADGVSNFSFTKPLTPIVWESLRKREEKSEYPIRTIDAAGSQQFYSAAANSPRASGFVLCILVENLSPRRRALLGRYSIERVVFDPTSVYKDTTWWPDDKQDQERYLHYCRDRGIDVDGLLKRNKVVI